MEGSDGLPDREPRPRYSSGWVFLGAILTLVLVGAFLIGLLFALGAP